jgi:hypothetical protein
VSGVHTSPAGGSASYHLSLAYSFRAGRLSRALVDAVSARPGEIDRDRVRRLNDLLQRNGKAWTPVTARLIRETRAMEREHRAWMRRQRVHVATPKAQATNPPPALGQAATTDEATRGVAHA